MPSGNRRDECFISAQFGLRLCFPGCAGVCDAFRVPLTLLSVSPAAASPTAACAWRQTHSSATSSMEWDPLSLSGDRRWQQRPWVREDGLFSDTPASGCFPDQHVSLFIARELRRKSKRHRYERDGAD